MHQSPFDASRPGTVIYSAAMPIVKAFIRAMLGFSRTLNSEVVIRGYRVFEGMFGNPAYPTPPVDLMAFKALLDRFASAVAEATHGDRRCIAERNELRTQVVVNLTQLGHYVEHACKNERATFVSSGFDPMPSAFSPLELLPQPRVSGVKQGRSGELFLKITPLGRKARSYDYRYAGQTPDGGQTDWIELKIPSVRTPVAIRDLTPGVIYVFQVRAYGKLGHTDWSPSVTKMCT